MFSRLQIHKNLEKLKKKMKQSGRQEMIYLLETKSKS